MLRVRRLRKVCGGSVPFGLHQAELIAAERTDIKEDADGFGDALDEKSWAAALPVDEPARRFRQVSSAFRLATAVLQQVGNLQRGKCGRVRRSSSHTTRRFFAGRLEKKRGEGSR